MCCNKITVHERCTCRDNSFSKIYKSIFGFKGRYQLVCLGNGEASPTLNDVFNPALVVVLEYGQDLERTA
ncbi:unnamed protein product [Periconia digitata]|uniref:Uncharacterized protein n=1 Tax=Periconia digitata TaxID=1303443 RepID=A0A9W4U0C0_9PLEO|nr:unnamed protein product [Periconia digitata]